MVIIELYISYRTRCAAPLLSQQEHWVSLQNLFDWKMIFKDVFGAGCWLVRNLNIEINRDRALKPLGEEPHQLCVFIVLCADCLKLDGRSPCILCLLNRHQVKDVAGVTEACVINELFKGMWASSQVRYTIVVSQQTYTERSGSLTSYVVGRNIGGAKYTTYET